MPGRRSQEYLEQLRRERLAQLEAKARRRRRRTVLLAVLSVFAACTIAVLLITYGVERSRRRIVPPPTPTEVVRPPAPATPTGQRPTS